ncbi:MAG TPA: DUF1007 family protein [Xanthobacteraceae bacterium]|nr:DUF1007 family protein [Xanthobacteraceae bacterium]
MVLKAALRLFTAAAIFAGGCGVALSHPHVIVVGKSELVFGKDGAVTAIRHAWTFDELFSEYATQGLDKNKDGVLSRDELSELAKVNVESLKEFEYFTTGKSGPGKLEFAEPTDYYLEHNDKLLTLHFTLPVKAGSQKSGLSLDVFDPTYFVAFNLAEDNPVKLIDAPANCSFEVKRPKQDATQTPTESFFNSLTAASEYGSQFANRVTVTCK